jgi:hypothetical protein
MLEKQILDLVERYLAQRVDRAGFAQEFANLYFQARNDRNVSRDARQLCDQLVVPFAEVSRGHRNESSFREELTRIAHPFAVREEVIEPSAQPFMISESEDIELDLALTRKPPSKALAIGRMDEYQLSYGA